MSVRKTLPLLAAAAFLVTACTSTSDAGNQPAAATSSAPAPVTQATEEQNKAAVLKLYSEAFNQNKTDVVTNLVNSGVDVQKSFQDIKAKIPGAVATVKHSAADGDLVAVQWQASATPNDEKTGDAVVDLYKLTGGKIVEHHEVVQKVPATTASGNSMFSDVYKYPNGAPTLTEDQEETNKQFGAKSYGSMGIDPTIIDTNWDSRYYQHNPGVADGTAGLKKMLQGIPPAAAGTTPRQFQYQLADGDLVWYAGSDFVGVDIFRVVNGKFVEHWDVINGQ